MAIERAQEQQRLEPEFRDPECKPTMGVYYSLREHSIFGIVGAYFKPTDLFTWRFRLFTFLVTLPWSIYFFLFTDEVAAKAAAERAKRQQLCNQPSPSYVTTTTSYAAMPPPSSVGKLPPAPRGWPAPPMLVPPLGLQMPPAAGCSPDPPASSVLRVEWFGDPMFAKIAAAVVSFLVARAMLCLCMLPFRLQRSSNASAAKLARPAKSISILIGLGLMGYGIYCAVFTQRRAQHSNPSARDCAIYFATSLLLVELGVDLLCWILNPTPLFVPSCWRNYNSTRAVDYFFATRPMYVPYYVDQDPQEAATAAAGVQEEADAAPGAAGKPGEQGKAGSKDVEVGALSGCSYRGSW